jgi:N-acetylglucosaminyl-diphospho-decaprenol L-rhamnosyltransferase
MSRIGAIIVTHNNERTIRSCVESLYEHAIHRIVVVDNASEDGTLDVLHDLGVPAIQNTRNKGFAAACNQGASNLDADVTYLLFINPDAIAMCDMRKTIHYLEHHPRAAIAGLLLTDENGIPESGGYGDEVTIARLFSRQMQSMRSQSRRLRRRNERDGSFGGRRVAPFLTAWVSGGAMVGRRAVFEEVRGFDEAFFLYWVDVDLCRRARQAGYAVVVMPSCTVVHARGESMADTRKKAAIYDASADRYFRKHYAAPIWICHFLIRRIYRFLRPHSQ